MKKQAATVHDLKRAKDLIIQGKTKLAGRVPAGGPPHDFTVEAVVPHQNFGLQWQTVSAGFGELTVYQGEDGRTHCSSETMGRDFVRAVLRKLADDVVIDD